MLEWYLLKPFQYFTNYIEKLARIQLEVKDNKPYAILYKFADKVELKFVHYINKFDEFKVLNMLFMIRYFMI